MCIAGCVLWTPGIGGTSGIGVSIGCDIGCGRGEGVRGCVLDSMNRAARCVQWTPGISVIGVGIGCGRGGGYYGVCMCVKRVCERLR